MSLAPLDRISVAGSGVTQLGISVTSARVHTLDGKPLPRSPIATEVSELVDAAIIGIGDSPCRPYIDCSRSACSGLVGIPVEGPARWTSQMTMGSSVFTARPASASSSS